MEDFIKLTERFFYYLQYGLMISPETVLHNEKNYVMYSLFPNDFYSLLKKYELVYPYNWEIETIKISNKCKENNLKIDECFNVINNYKGHYIFGSPILFEKQIERIREQHKRVNKGITESDLLQCIVEYIKYLTQKRDEIIQSLIQSIALNNEQPYSKKEIQTQNPDNKELLINPFRDKETKDVFEFIVNNWSNTNANKWGYIWRFLVDEGKGKLTTKMDYENYLRTNKGFTTGKVNYDSCNSQKHYEKLTELYKEFKQI